MMRPQLVWMAWFVGVTFLAGCGDRPPESSSSGGQASSAQPPGLPVAPSPPRFLQNPSGEGGADSERLDGSTKSSEPHSNTVGDAGGEANPASRSGDSMAGGSAVEGKGADKKGSATLSHKTPARDAVAGSATEVESREADERCYFGAYLPDGRVLATFVSRVSSRLVILDGKTGEERMGVSSPMGWVAAVSRSGRVFATHIPDGIVVFEVPSLKVIRTLACDSRSIRQLELSERGRVLVATSDDDFYVYDVRESRMLHHVSIRKGFGRLSMSSDGTRAFTSGNVDKYWNLETGKEIRTELRRCGPSLFLPGRSSEYGICGNSSGQLGVTHFGSGKVQTQFRWPLPPRQGSRNASRTFHGSATCMDLSSDGKKLVAGYVSGEVVVWNVESGTLERELPGHVTRVSSVSFSPDSTSIASCSASVGTLYLSPISGQTPVAVDRDNSVIPLDPSLVAQFRKYHTAILSKLRERKITESHRLCDQAAELAVQHPECPDIMKAFFYNKGLDSRKSPEEAVAWARKYYPRLKSLQGKPILSQDVELEAMRAEIWVLVRSGRNDEAIRRCTESVKRAVELEGPESPMAEYFESSILMVLFRTGQHGKAESRCLSRVASAKKRVAQPAQDDEDRERRLRRLTFAINDLTTAYTRQKKYDEAIRVYQDFLENDDPNPEFQSFYLQRLGRLFDDAGRVDDAESALTKAFAVVDERHRDALLDAMFRFYEKHKKFDKLAAVIDEQIARERKVRGQGDSTFLLSFGRFTNLLSKSHQWDDVARLLDDERHGWCEYAQSSLASKPEWSQLLFLNGTYRPRFSEAMSFAWHRRDDPGMAAMSAGWVINGKNVRVAVLAERQRLALAASDPELKKVVAELNDTRSKIAALSMINVQKESNSDDGARNASFSKLRHAAHELSLQVSVAGWTEKREEAWVALQEVQERLPNDGVLVEFLKAPVFDEPLPERGALSTKPSDVRYLAWVIHPRGRGSAKLVDLGSALAIDAAVVDCHRKIQALSNSGLAARRREALDAVNHSLELAASLVLRPLLPYIRDTPQWVLCPDAALWMIPWSGLLTEKGRYAVEDHTLTYVGSGRDLTSTFGDQAADGEGVVVADPDFGSPKTASEKSRISFPPLPGTAQEAEKISPFVKTMAGGRLRMFNRGDATEQAVKALVRPKILVLSTHGFFLPFENGGNVLAGCGLALAGANRAVHGRTDSNDGLLTGVEILGMDLRRTELVVLSACETGVGVLEYGEGVVGLRRAFQMAGARSVLATLWSIPDRETAALMTGFFRSYRDCHDYARSIQLAQKAMIERQRKNNGLVDPVEWAAFTLTVR